MAGSNGHERSPLQSKKFVAFLVQEITWKVILGAVLILGIKEGKIDHFIAAISFVVILVAGFNEAGYILGQASLDKYVRLAQIAADAGQAVIGVVDKLKPPKSSKKKPPIDDAIASIEIEDVGDDDG